MKSYRAMQATVFFWALCFASVVFGQGWTQTEAPVKSWRSVACSADGNTAVAVSGDTWPNAGSIYLSTNAGASWTLSSAPSNFWTGVACSANGLRLVAVAGGYGGTGPICLSTNGGLDWINVAASEGPWTAVASSADGSIIVAASQPMFGGGFAVSTNGAATWQDHLPAFSFWYSAACSADGKMLVVIGNTGDNHFSRGTIATSKDRGTTWALTEDFNYWLSVACSADGNKLLGGAVSLQTSPDFGVTWNIATVPVARWYSVASSADGNRLVAAGGGEGQIAPMYISTNTGAAWGQAEAPTTNWYGVASSADGCRMFAAVNGGGIWTSQTTPAPVLNIRQSGDSLLLSWIVPSMEFALQESADLRKWSGVDAIRVLNDTNLHYGVSLTPPASPRFYRLALKE